MLKNIVFSGGGFYGLMMIGCVRALEERGLLKHIHTLVGCSAGAILSLGVALGYTSQELEEYAIDKLCQSQGGTHTADIPFDQLLSIVDTYGISDGEMINQLARDLLIKKCNAADMDFIEFAKRTGKNLVVVGTNVSQGRTEFFCVDKTPDLSIIKAIRISCSLPLLFLPVTLNGDLYIDGGLFDNFPMDYVELRDTLHRLDTIGFHIHQPPPPITNIATFISKILYMVHEKAGNARRESENICVLHINGKLDSWMSLIDMSFKKEDICAMIQKGYEEGCGYCDARFTPPPAPESSS